MPKVPIYVIQAAIPWYTNESIICRCYFPSDTKVISGTFTNIDQYSPQPGAAEENGWEIQVL